MNPTLTEALAAAERGETLAIELEPYQVEMIAAYAKAARARDATDPALVHFGTFRGDNLDSYFLHALIAGAHYEAEAEQEAA